MTTKIDKGKRGEDIAADYLVDQGYTIEERNWRVSRSEVDLIARQGDVCVFVEVKYRTTGVFGHPEEAVTEHKMDMLDRAVEVYWHEHPEYKSIRIDIISITVDKKKDEMQIYHIEDVYF